MKPISTAARTTLTLVVFAALNCGVVNAFTTHSSNMVRFVSYLAALLVLPAVCLYQMYCASLRKLQDEKGNVEEMASLHLRTIEALAFAIEAKDQATNDHLQRVRVYALEIAKHLNISPEDMQALKAAALLHDIGKLAVPEHILSKPGRLTPEEFEKLKIHPTVGADILEQVKFPYPVAQVVRAHHERWDGSGYPNGLKGEAIPIGARILAAVDCLDALASERKHRRAIALDEAMTQVVAMSGKSFDPAVIEVLQARHKELEALAQSRADKSRRAALPAIAAGNEVDAIASDGLDIEKPEAPQPDFCSSIAAARQEVQMLFELSHDLGNSLSLDETLSVLAVRLKRLVPHDAIAIYIHKDEKLVPEFVNGDNFRLFSSLEIPIGQGLSGWVAQSGKPILNGNPSVEPGYLNDPTKFSTLRSAVSVPLEGLSGVVGVLALYRSEADAFTKDHLRILLAISGKLALSIENALKYRLAESSAATDYLTGLPNARSLFMHLDRELSRCKRSEESLAVLVCDLDGFKQVNDRFGHLEGNKLLRAFATRLKESCREYDYVARMGGDEFVIIAPGMSKDDAGERIHQLEQIAVDTGKAFSRDMAANTDLAGDATRTSESGVAQFEPEIILSVSIGDAYYSDHKSDAETLLTEADRRMYSAKQQHQSPGRPHSRTLQFPLPTANAAAAN